MSYTIAFSLAFLGYEARTGLNPTQNVAAIVQVCVPGSRGRAGRQAGRRRGIGRRGGTVPPLPRYLRVILYNSTHPTSTPPAPPPPPQICILMWAGNNVTRPFRLAGAAAIAPAVDALMDRLQARLRLPSKAAAFALLAAALAAVCFAVLGALFLSRWVQG